MDSVTLDPHDRGVADRSARELEVRFRANQGTARAWRRSGRLGPSSRRLTRAVINRLASSDINAKIELQQGVVLMHRGLGNVIHARAEIIPPAIIFHRVTIGNNWGQADGVPRIQPFSFIGAGATILGGIQIGPFAAVGAGAVVTQDVPPFTTASGVPAGLSSLDTDSIMRWFRLSSEELSALRAAHVGARSEACGGPPGNRRR